MPYQETLKVPVGGGGSGTSPCGGGTYGGLLTFTNGGTKFTATSTSCTVSITAGGNAVANTDYDLRWTLIFSGCLTKSGSNNYTFASTLNKKYTFTVYFLTGHVPADGTDIQITVTFS